MKNITERHQFILRKLREEGKVEIPTLIDEMKVSGVTIRKDLKLLEQKRLLFRTKGGASTKNPYAGERHINEKEFIQSNEKRAIALAALKLIGHHDSIVIGSGTTNFELAKVLFPDKRLMVITPATKVSVELNGRPNVEILQLGGIIQPTSAAVAGSIAEKILEELACGVLFLGVDGLDVEHGVTVSNIYEAGLNKKMIELAQTVVALADSTKFNRRGLGKICDLSKIDYIVTDNNIATSLVAKFEKTGVRVIIAK